MACALLAVGCGASAAQTPRPKLPPAAVAAPPPPPSPEASVKVSGLTGTLNKDDVHQTMDARQPDFDTCITRVKRRQAWVHGTIRFTFAVDGQGVIEDVHAVESDIGHDELERCLTDVVKATQFPRPAGRATARFDWDMHVEGAYSAVPEPIDPKTLRKLVQKKAKELFRDCNVRRFRNRFNVTAYVNRSGRVLSAGLVPSRPLDDEKLVCVLETVKQWQLPKPKKRSKVSFLLR